MLGKLIKYELKTTARSYFLLYGCLLLLAVLNVVLLRMNSFFQTDGGNLLNILAVLSSIFLVLYLMSIFLVTVILNILRFHKNLLGDEGYLMNTLPVSPSGNIAGKLITAVIWSVVSVLVILASFLVFVYGVSDIAFPAFFRDLLTLCSRFFQEFGWSGISAIAEFCLLCTLGLTNFYLLVYASMAIGHSFNRHKMLYSVLAYILLSIIENIISFSCLWLLSRFPGFAGYLNGLQTMKGIPHGYIGSLMGVIAVYGTAYFFIARYFLSRHLNLQ